MVLRILAAVALASVFLIAGHAGGREAPGDMKRFNVTCEAIELCPLLKQQREKCEQSELKNCDEFIGTMRRLLLEYDCQRPFDSKAANGRAEYVVPAIWLCPITIDESSVLIEDPFEDALETLVRLKSGQALQLLASKELRGSLDGHYAEVYLEESIRAEKLLTGTGERPDGKRRTMKP